MFSPLNDPNVTDWFRRLDTAWRRMPAEEQQRQREEMQQHLEGLVTAKVAAGQSAEDAWNAALVQFGNPAQIGHKVYQEWCQSKVGFRAEIMAVLFGLGLSALNYGLIQLLLSSPLIILYFTGNLYPQWLYTTAFSIALETIFYGGGILSYVLLGRKYPFQAIKGALFTFVLSALLGWIPVTAYVVRGNHINPAHVLTAMATRTLPLVPSRLAGIVMLSYLASVTKRGWYKPTFEDFKLTLPKRRQTIH